MTMNIEAGSRRKHRTAERLGSSALLPWLVIAVLLIAAVFIRHAVAANTDVSWLLTVGERILDGRRLYADVIETNPPMAVLVYLPGILIARSLGLPVELVTDGLVFIAIFISLGIAARILKNSAVLRDVQGWPLAILAFAILAILPTQIFGQREHIALVELLPALAVFCVRMKGEAPRRWAIVAAGVGEGLALTFKPYFAIGIVFALGSLALYSRSWRIIFKPENLIAGSVAGAYAVCVAVFTPEFFTVIGPLVRDIYIPVGISLEALVQKPALPIAAAAMFAAMLLQRRDRIDVTCLLLLATSLGFAVVFALQRKGWPYHSYPMIALALLALGYALTSSKPGATFDRALRAGLMVLFAVLFTQSMLWFDVAFDARPLQASVARLGPHPKILAITAEPGIGHPLVRALDGTWVSRQQGLWVAGYLHYMRQHGMLDPQREKTLDVYAERERAMLIEDIKRTQPTVLLVDNLTGDWEAWLRANPDIGNLLKDFRPVETLNGIDILSRTN